MSCEQGLFRSGWSAIVRFLRLGALAATALGGAAALVASTPAEAVPSFARQTGFACEACHTVFPELTPFGRRFKLNGYTLTTTQDGVSDINAAKEKVLALAPFPPLSFLLQATYDRWNRAPIDGNGLPGQNDTAQFPEVMTIMYGGRVTDNIGAFLELSWTQWTGTVGIDLSEVRYSDHNSDNSLVWGIFANNTMSMQDVWNTGPVWSIPAFTMQGLYQGTNPSVAGFTGGLRTPLMYNLATQNVVGVGAYVFYNDSFYLEGSAYKSAKPGFTAEDSTNLNVNGGTIQGAAPYWRAGYEHDWGKNSFFVGTTGMYANFTPCVYAPGGTWTGPCSVDGITPEPLVEGPSNHYLDVSGDWQYQYIGDEHIFTFAGHYMHESVNINPAFITNAEYSNTTDYLDMFQVTASYYYQRRFGGYVSFVSTTGNNDVNLMGGNGSQNNQYEVFEFDYMPWLNTKFLIQYDLYNRVANNQNPFFAAGYSTKASDNNTILGGLWMAF